MKTPLRTKLIVAANVVAVAVIVLIIFLHNFQTSESAEQKVLSINKNTERASFRPMTDHEELDTDAFVALFDEEKDDKDEEKEEEYEEDETADEADDMNPDVSERADVEEDKTDSSTAEEDTTTQNETKNQSESSTQSSSNSSSSWQPPSKETTNSSGSTSGNGDSTTSTDNSNSNPPPQEKLEETTPTPDCNQYQVISDGKCVNKTYASLVQARLSAPFSAKGGNPIAIKYDGVQFGKITPGQVNEDGTDTTPGRITSLGGNNYTEKRKEELRAQLSGLIN